MGRTFTHRKGWVQGSVAVAIRTRAEVNEKSEFEVPEEYADDVATLQRLIDAGHEPVNPGDLPAGVEYEADEADDSAEAEGSDSSEDGEAADESEGAEEPDDDLADLDRSELWELAHSDEYDGEPEFSWNESTAEKLREWIREREE